MKWATVLMLIHSWYPDFCCSDKDCRPVPCQEITRGMEGNHLTFYYQGKKLITTTVKESPDGECHVCVDSYAFRCLFLPEET